MLVGIPKEIKNNENRVGITPAGVTTLVNAGHAVYVEKSAGLGSGINDSDYERAGAHLLDTAKEIFDRAEMIIKVKEPLPEEYEYFREGQILYTYLHLASNPVLTKALLEKKIVGIAYETVQMDDRSLPLLSPMSEVAGRMAIQIGAHFLEKPMGGSGVLLGGVPGVESGIVIIVGGGIVGINAARIAVGFGASVTIVEKNPERLRQLDNLFMGRVKTVMSNTFNLEKEVAKADLLVGAVLIPGARAPRLVTEDMVKNMKKSSVIVDVAIDQGGSIETIDRVTTHSDPVYIKHGVVHYSVANIPGAVARTSTFALTNVTIPYALEVASKGWRKAIVDNSALAKGVNLVEGKITYKAVAEAHNIPYTPIGKAI